MPALMIANISVVNQEKFQQYLSKTQEVARPYGAELLSRGKCDKTLTGEDRDHSLVVIVRFPSVEKLNEWHESEEYRALIPLREDAANIKMTSYEIMP